MDDIDELKSRIEQFNSLSLPGQGMSMHMGTSYLVNDLWREVLRLRELVRGLGNDVPIFCVRCCEYHLPYRACSRSVASTLGG